MVRKSERNKAKGTPEKTAEKTSRKSVRHSRRKRKSSSESEPEPDVAVEEVKDNVEEKEESSEVKPQKSESSDVKVDSEGVGSGSARLKRSLRRQAAEADANAKPQSTEKDWKEDDTFWSGEGDTTVGTSEAKPKEDEGSLWKVQSANGSSGEIQKLKICRQRPADASESSPSSAKDSPVRKRGSRGEVESDSGGGEGEAPSSTVPDQSEAIAADSTEALVSPAEEATAPAKEEEEGEPSQSDERPAQGSDPPAEAHQEETPNSTEDMEPPAEAVSRSTPDKEVPDSSTRRKRATSNSSESGSDCSSNRSQKREDESQKSSQSSEAAEKKTTEAEPVEKTEEVSATKEEEEAEVSSEVTEAVPLPSEPVEEEKEPEPAAEEKPSEEEAKTEEVAEKEEQAVDPKEEDKEAVVEEKEKTEEEEKEKNIESTSEEASSESEKKTEQPAKKPKEKIQYDLDKSEKVEPVKEKEPPKEKEEGELSPVQKENRTQPRILVINKPQEHYTTKPTILKRKTEEGQPVQRKRRLAGERKPRVSDEPTLTISSQSLKLLVPDAKPLAPEEVDLSYDGGKGEGVEEAEEEEGAVEEGEESSAAAEEAMEQEEAAEEEAKPRKVELKARDMEIRVKNDVREVTKKEPPRKTSRDDKPKDTSHQENHKGQVPLDKVQRKEKLSVKVNTNESKFMRKISIVSDDAKKVTRSPSPAGRKPTAVLFITNLVRPFTAPQLRELLARTGTIAPNGFYIDKIKSKCYVKYTEVDMAVETRHALHGVRWPVNNPKTLKVEFASMEDMAAVQDMADDQNKKPESVDSGWLNEQAALKPIRRVTAGVREWDVGKVTGAEGGGGVVVKEESSERKRVAEEDWGRSNKERERGGGEPERRRERAHTPDNKDYQAPRKLKKRDNDAPSKLLDNLFKKTRTTPSIYWLPLTASQIVIKEEMRRQQLAEHERRLAEIRKSEQCRRDRERERRKK